MKPTQIKNEWLEIVPPTAYFKGHDNDIGRLGEEAYTSAREKYKGFRELQAKVESRWKNFYINDLLRPLTSAPGVEQSYVPTQSHYAPCDTNFPCLHQFTSQDQAWDEPVPIIQSEHTPFQFPSLTLG